MTEKPAHTPLPPTVLSRLKHGDTVTLRLNNGEVSPPVQLIYPTHHGTAQVNWPVPLGRCKWPGQLTGVRLTDVVHVIHVRDKEVWRGSTHVLPEYVP